LAFLSRPGIGLLARLIIGVVFVISAAGKLTHLDAFVRAVDSYGILPEPLLSLFGAAFPWLELLMGVLLLLGLFTKAAAAGAAGLMLAFIALMLTALAQGKSIDCGCFVGIIQETVGPATLVRDGVLLAVVVPALLAPVHAFSLDARLRLRRPSFSKSLALAGFGVVLSAVLGAGIVAVWAAFAPATLPSEGGWRLGPADAKVQIVVFSDFQCPACAVVDPVFKRLVNDYNGSVAFVYRHFPLSSHKNAVTDAVASEAAGEQGKFWEMHDFIFAVKGEATPAQLRDAAGRMGLDLRRYDAAISSGRALKRVEDDYNEALRINVTYTPYTLVNGEVVQSITYDGLRAAVERNLNR
jgi:protein-disulfide isomerase